MAFGFRILTTDGYSDVADMKTCQLVDQFTTTATSGTRTVSDFDSGTGFIYRRPAAGSTDFAAFTTQTWNNSTKEFAWADNDNNDSLTWFFFRTEIP